MSMVTVHGPYTFGSKSLVEAGPVQATVTPANKQIWTFRLDGATTRVAGDFLWTFPTGTPATAPGPGPHTVTFAGTGNKAVTCAVTGAGTGANPYPPAATYPLPITIPATGPAPLMGEQEPTDAEEIIPEPSVGPAAEGYVGEDTEEIPVVSSEVPIAYDPAAHTVSEVQTYAAEHPDQMEDIYEAEVAGKARATLVTWLENQFPYDPGAWTVTEVLDYAAENPGELEEIITSEQSGKARTTLLTQLEAMRE